MENSSNLLPTETATIKRLLANPSVEGIILTNEEGQLQYSSLDNNLTFLVTSKLFLFANVARATIRDLNPTDHLLTFRLQTRSKEIMVVAPEHGMQVIVMQKITSSSSTIRENENELIDNA